MLSSIVGSIDWPAAVVLAGLFIGIGICFVIYRTTPKTAKEDYELQRMEKENNLKIHLTRIQADNDFQKAKLEQNLITSHKEVRSAGIEY